ncbi:unnamed protein product, partial [marine sediment metagenome]
YLKDIPLISTEKMNAFIEIGKNTGVTNVQWSGLTKREDVKNSS